ncbi:MAG: MFS transporter [Clostridia bacterium]|nr:MFS transporter [Clostridia bacterium]
MKRFRSYTPTMVACYLGYVTQAITINLTPLLYVTFQQTFSLSLGQVGMLILVVFVTQIGVDLSSTRFGRMISYRTGCVLAAVFATLGLVSFSFLPDVLPDPYVGVILSSVLLSVGSGFVEVQVSPVVDAMPEERKTGAMSILHSFYCWGFTAVVLLSTLFFVTVGIHRWRLLMLLWAVIPAVTGALFCFVRMPVKTEERTGGGMAVRQLLSGRMFWLLMLLMVCAGAAEMVPAQWASLFAEAGLGVSKTVGDLLGPCTFALLQGLSRVAFGLFSVRWDSRRMLFFCGVLSLAGYSLIMLSPWPLLSLFGFGLCGIAIGPMWPGTLSLGSSRYPAGGTGMFGLLAFCGDFGCAVSPALIGAVSDRLQAEGAPVLEALRAGFGVCALFPAALLVILWLLGRCKLAEDSSARS